MSLEINKRITECRKKAKMTKKEVAQRLGIKYTTYCRMEKEAKRITHEEVERIAKVIGADVNYILYGYDFTPLEPKIVTVETPTKGATPFDTPEVPVLKYKHGDFDCTAEEKALILKYRSLPFEEKQAVRRLIDGLDK